MNYVFLIGRLTKDIELRYTTSNKAKGTTSIAVNRPKQKDKEQEVDFINVVIWDKKAETASKYLKKGSQVAISGRIQTRSYETEKGEKRYITEVVANEIKFLDNKKSDAPLPPEPDYLGQSQNNPYQEMGNQVSADFQDEEGYPWEI